MLEVPWGKPALVEDPISPEVYRGITADVLARTLYGEAGKGTVELKEAVASVIINRLYIAKANKKHWWGNSIIQICQKPYQFKCWNRSSPLLREIIEVDEEDIVFMNCWTIL